MFQGELIDGSFYGNPPMYGIMYGTKTTIYVPDELKSALARRARVERRSEADIIREALLAATQAYMTPEPRAPLGPGRGPADLSERVDDYLAGFGAE